MKFDPEKYPMALKEFELFLDTFYKDGVSMEYYHFEKLPFLCQVSVWQKYLDSKEIITNVMWVRRDLVGNDTWNQSCQTYY